MKKLSTFVLSAAFLQVCSAEMIPVSVERSDDNEMERIDGRCDPEGLNLVCHLTETKIRTKDASCKVSSRHYVLTLQQQGPRTWGMWSNGGMCKVAEAVTMDLVPTNGPLSWPGVLKYTIKSTVESRKDVPQLCTGVKDEETYVYLKSDSYQPKARKCETVSFGF